jgi:hypothetical protein
MTPFSHSAHRTATCGSAAGATVFVPGYEQQLHQLSQRTRSETGLSVFDAFGQAVPVLQLAKATKIVELVPAGELDAQRLCRAALSEMSLPPPKAPIGL